MTNAAAAIRTLRSPRRRPHGPAAWEHAGAVSGVVGASALVTAMCVLSSTPTVDSTDVAQWRRTVTLVAGTIGIAMLALAGALLANRRTIVRGDDVTFSEEDS